jgi:hypothetical protein
MTMAAVTATAQRVTYNHDSPKMNQITVGESGSGALSPSLYYQSLHSNYSSDAAARNKQLYRMEASVQAYNQVAHAKIIDSAMVKRAEVEALNVADRSGGSLDLAWMAEGEKITEKLADFKSNIDRLVRITVSATDRSYWMDYYNIYSTAIKVTREAYMPNAQRKQQYLAIYDEIVRRNEALVMAIVRAYNIRIANTLMAVATNRKSNNATHAANAMQRWRKAGYGVCNSGGGSNGSGGLNGFTPGTQYPGVSGPTLGGMSQGSGN